MKTELYDRNVGPGEGKIWASCPFHPKAGLQTIGHCEECQKERVHERLAPKRIYSEPYRRT